jgi:hypothetical protein
LGTGAREAASHGELNLSDRGVGNLLEVSGHGGTRLARGGGGSTVVGRRATEEGDGQVGEGAGCCTVLWDLVG